MSSSVLFGVLLSVVSFSTLVIGDPNHIIKMTKLGIENKGCSEYFGTWTAKVEDTKKSSKLSFDLPVKIDLPEEMMVSLVINLPANEPIVSNMSVCEAMDDKKVGQSFVKSGKPSGFPRECPFVKGDWTVDKWVPPVDPIPSGAEGVMWGVATVGIEGQEPCLRIDYEADLSSAPPDTRR